MLSSSKTKQNLHSEAEVEIIRSSMKLNKLYKHATTKNKISSACTIKEALPSLNAACVGIMLA